MPRHWTPIRSDSVSLIAGCNAPASSEARQTTQCLPMGLEEADNVTEVAASMVRWRWRWQ